MAEFQIRHPYHSQGLAAGGSALLDAIDRGKVHLAKFILDAGEYDIINTKDFKGKTPLIRACYIKVCSLVEVHFTSGLQVLKLGPHIFNDGSPILTFPVLQALLPI